MPAYAAALGGLTAQQVDYLLTTDWREPDYDYLWFYRQFWREDLEPLAQLRWLDLNTDLAEGLLTKVDRTSMAHSLEVRPPLLDHRLVEFMLSVDPKLLVDERRRRGKLLVRQLDGATIAAAALEPAQIRLWTSRAPMAQAPPASCCRTPCGGLMDRGILKRAVSSEFRRAWYLLVLDRWFTAFD